MAFTESAANNTRLQNRRFPFAATKCESILVRLGGKKGIAHVLKGQHLFFFFFNPDAVWLANTSETKSLLFHNTTAKIPRADNFENPLKF